MNLEENLRHSAEAWLEAEPSTPTDEADLARMVRGLRQERQRRRAIKLGGAVASALLAVLFWPVMLSLASGLPVIGPFLAEVRAHDQGARWADEHGYVIPVGKESTHGEYTLRVDSYFADSARTTIFYTIFGPDLAERGPVRWSPAFNLIHPGSFSGGGQLEDGYVVGKLDLPALPLPLTHVSLAVEGIGQVQGRWRVSFLASRLALDQFSRVLVIDQEIATGDVAWTVHQVTLAPTRTLVELQGRHGADLSIRGAELEADGRLVQMSRVQSQTTERTGGSGPVTTVRLHGDPLAGDPEELILRLTDVVRWVEGGPSLPLAPGASAQVGKVQVQFESVQRAPGTTLVTVRLTGDDPHSKVAPLTFRGWELIAETGEQVREAGEVLQGTEAGELLTITFPGEFEGKLHLRPAHHAEPIPGPIEISIPLS